MPARTMAAPRHRYADDDLLRVLAEPLRWQIVQLLAAEDMCVCHLTEELDVPQSLVSHHLRALREAGLVDTERYRYWTYYRLRTAALQSLATRVAAMARTRRRNVRRRPCG